MSRIKKIIARSHGDQQTGLGHVFRLIGLTSIFESYTSITFLGSSGIPSNLIPDELAYQEIPDEIAMTLAEPEWIINHFNPNEYVIFLDGYLFDREYQKILKTAKFDIVYIDDLIQEGQQACVLLNPSFGVSKNDYKDSETEIFGLGPQYAALRRSFLTAASTTTKVGRSNISSIFVCFGGSDQYNLALKVAEKLVEEVSIERIEILAGPYNTILSKSDKIIMHKRLNDLELLEVVSNTDAAITSASTISYEVCCIRKPLLVGWYADNQKQLYKGLIDNELAEGLGNILELNDDELTVSIKGFLNADHQALVYKQIELFDGGNEGRLRKMIYPLLGPIGMRKVEIGDVELIYNWANDPDVRMQSLNSDPIPYENHEMWFNDRIQRKDSPYFIAIVEKQPVGQLRLDKKGEYYLVSYLVDKAHRGKGYGLQIVALGIDLLKEEHPSAKFVAHVKHENVASQKVFEKLGFARSESAQDPEVFIFAT